MLETVSSRHLRGASEVLLLPKIRAGFVDNSELVLSYTSRLKALLTTLFELRRIATDLGTGDYAGPIERLQTVYDVQWTVLEEERTLLVAASFDRSWEDYFRLLFEITGPLLDSIFMHCEGYRDFEDSFEGFTAWVRGTQRECNLFYLANADFTTDDGRYLKDFLRRPERERASLRIGPPIAAPVPEQQRFDRARDLARALQTLYDLRKFFPATEQLLGDERSAQAVFDTAMGGVFYSERDRVRELVEAQALTVPVQRWAASLVHAEEVRLWNRRPSLGPTRWLTPDELENIQAGILRDYSSLANRGAAVLVRAETPEIWSAFLDHAIRSVTTEASPRAPDALRWNVALTYGGLERLGLSQEMLERFPIEFREGMEKRSGLLGDVDDPKYPRDTWPSRPGSSRERTPLAVADALVLLQRKTDDPRAFDAEIAKLTDLGVDVLFVQPLFRALEHLHGVTVDREPFGFVEGHPQVSSQPAPNVVLETAGGPIDLAAAALERDRVPVGELLLGFPDQHGELRPHADPSGLFTHSTFLVVRKLEQKVSAFEAYVSKLRGEMMSDRVSKLASAVHEFGFRRLSDTPLMRRGRRWQRRSNRTNSFGLPVEQVKAWLLGRTIEGVPLTERQTDRPNDFDYSQDTGRCPFFAHIRRANPREPGTPRIVRRRFSFADDAGEHQREVRGTFFMAYNASIAGQFEIIQRWINGGNRTGIHSAQRDLIAGQSTSVSAPYYAPEAMGRPRSFAPPPEPMVRLHWGLYLFVPAVTALTRLKQIAGARQHDAQLHVDGSEAIEGERLIQQLLQLAALNQLPRQGEPQHAAEERQRAFRDVCKQLIEEPLNHRRTAQVWSAIRAYHQGALNVPGFGVLVGSAEAADRVLSNRGDQYSVQDYVALMAQTIGQHYLSYDQLPSGAGPQPYAAESTEANQFLRNLSFDDAYREAFDAGRALIAHGAEVPGFAAVRHEEGPDGRRAVVDAEAYATFIVARWAQHWLGLSNDPDASDEVLIRALDRSVVVSRYMFQTEPAPTLRKRALATRPLFENAKGLGGELSKALAQTNVDAAVIDRAARGAVVGFAAPSIAAIRVVLDAWTDDDTLWAIAESARTAGGVDRGHKLRARIIEALARQPIPTLLYRHAAANTRLGGTDIAQGARVFVGLGSACSDVFERAANIDMDEAARERLREQAASWLFGGAPSPVEVQPRPAGTSHGCPARHAALGVLSGAIAALLIQPDLRVEYRSGYSCALPSI